MSTEVAPPPPAIAPAEPSTFRKALRQKRFTVGLGITLLLVAFVIFAPYFAPYGENEITGPPYSDVGLFGTDYLGQDVWSRVLYGGASILIISLLATALGMVLGIVIGVVAAYWGGWPDETIMRLNDVALAFPQILLVLLVLTAVDQPSWWMIVLLVGASHAPRVARLARVLGPVEVEEGSAGGPVPQGLPAVFRNGSQTQLVGIVAPSPVEVGCGNVGFNCASV